MSASRLSPELRAAVMAARGRMSVAVAATRFGVPRGTVAFLWHAALARGDVPPLATRRSLPGAPRIPNARPGRIRKAWGRAGEIVEGGVR